MYLIKFSNEGQDYLLHNGEFFIGGDTPQDISKICISLIATQLSAGGFTMIQADTEELLRLIGGCVPYKIIDLFGGLGVHWMGVPICSEPKKENDNELRID